MPTSGTRVQQASVECLKCVHQGAAQCGGWAPLGLHRCAALPVYALVRFPLHHRHVRSTQACVTVPCHLCRTALLTDWADVGSLRPELIAMDHGAAGCGTLAGVRPCRQLCAAPPEVFMLQVCCLSSRSAIASHSCSMLLHAHPACCSFCATYSNKLGRIFSACTTRWPAAMRWQRGTCRMCGTPSRPMSAQVQSVAGACWP